MVFDISKIENLGRYTKKNEQGREIFLKGEKAFLVLHQNTIELRCDNKLSDLLREKYESVMQSRYFGKNGIEVVLAGQLSEKELEDLVRLSYNLTT